VHDKLSPPDKGEHRESYPRPRRKGYGRRITDQPEITLSKKLLVILLAFVNVAYVAGEALLTVTNHGC